MEGMPESEQRHLWERLRERVVSMRCPACRQQEMRLANQYAQVALTSALHHPVALGNSNNCYLAAVLTCPQCGYLELHRTNALDL